jgi:hypothetical protein
MEYYLQQFKETSLIKRDSVKISTVIITVYLKKNGNKKKTDLAFVLMKYTNLQNIFSDTCNWFKHCFQSYP